MSGCTRSSSATASAPAACCGCRAPTTLALTNFSGAEPDFAFYGDSHGMLGPDDLDLARLADADVVYTGSIAMLRPPTLAAARAAWRVNGPRKVFDPNARPRLLADVAAYRDGGRGVRGRCRPGQAELRRRAVLWNADERTVAERLAGLGRATVVITRGAAGALLRHDGESRRSRRPGWRRSTRPAPGTR